MIQAFDTSSTQFLAQIIPHHPFFDAFFRLLSAEGFYLIVWIFIATIVFAIEYLSHHDKRRFLGNIYRVTAMLLVVALITFSSIHFILKPLIARDRPAVALSTIAPYCPTDYSFPSGHAAVAWAGAYVLIRFDTKKRREVMYFLIAALVSYSRIYLSCHFLGDVIIGALYGISIAALCYKAYERMRRI